MQSNRINSLDVAKGIVMLFMALDHTRDYFHADAFFHSPTHPEHTTWLVYFTRWITHFCAPTFCFLAGVSAYLVEQRKGKDALAQFLWKRGLWLIFAELTVINIAWYADLQFRNMSLMVIWVLGISMIVLAGLIYTSMRFILIFSLVVIAAHNLLDYITIEHNIIWSLLHQWDTFFIGSEHRLNVYYPILPWVAVLSLGYYMGKYYEITVQSALRKKLFYRIGGLCLTLFVVIRSINIYGDKRQWQYFETPLQTLMSFGNPSKYPPSLLYLLMTLGGMFVLLAFLETFKHKINEYLSVLGRVPFFYYVVHLAVIHLLAVIYAELSGFGGIHLIVLPDWINELEYLKGYGTTIYGVYLAWIVVIVLLYPLCAAFDYYKKNHKHQWWLSYL